MRKKYGVLLFVLLTANSVWPEERPPLRQRFVRYMHLHKASKFIKKQYRDKRKRRAWLSIGGVGIAIFLLKRIELLRTFWRSKEKKRRDSPAAQSVTSSHEKQPQSNADSDRAVDLSVPPTPPPSRNDEPSRSDSEEKDDIGNDMQAPLGQDAFQQQLSAALPESTKSTENQGGTAVRKSDAEIAIEETLRQAAEMAQRLRKAGVRHIARDASDNEEEGPPATGTVILHDDDEEEEELQGTVVLHPEAPHHAVANQAGGGAIVPKAAAAARRKATPQFAPVAEGIEKLIDKHNVISELTKLEKRKRQEAKPLTGKMPKEERRQTGEKAKQEMIERLKRDKKLSEPMARKVVEGAVKKIKQRIVLREAIQEEKFDQVVDLLTMDTTHNGQPKIQALVDKISHRGTLSASELENLALILWKILVKDETPISAEDLRRLQERTHSDRDDILAMVGEQPED